MFSTLNSRVTKKLIVLSKHFYSMPLIPRWGGGGGGSFGFTIHIVLFEINKLYCTLHFLNLLMFLEGKDSIKFVLSI
jgi:hypothetical protein